MKVKMIDVARHLGISKSTVSLVMNNKPGVNEETRKRVLQCFEELSREEGAILEKRKASATELTSVEKIIKVVFINHNKRIIVHPEMDLWSVVIKTFDMEARKRGLLYSMSYLEEDAFHMETIIEECNLDIVSGVIIFGTEMQESDYKILDRIKKPLVIYDYEMPDGKYCSVCIDNVNAVEQAVKRLKSAGAKDIRYFSTGKTIYNFVKRREAFRKCISEGKDSGKDFCIILGGTINEIMENAMIWLEKNDLPDAFLFENYQISIGVMLALRKKKISVPRDIKLIGIDEVPEYMLSGNELTYMKMPYRTRASVCMTLLDMLTQQYPDMKTKIFVEAEMVSNNSI